MKQESNQYDKIIRENLEAVIPGLLEKVLGIRAVRSEELPDDLQHTRERKPDALKRITDVEGKTFVLQLEFQVADDPAMVYRMLDYVGLLALKYKLPVRQFVIFLGSKPPKMPTSLEFDDLKFRFNLLAMNAIDYRLFLNADSPEEIVFGILSNFKGENPRTAIENIIHRLEATTPVQRDFQKFGTQLRLLAKLRKLQPLIDTVMDSIAQYFKDEEDTLYIRGEKKGIEKGLEKGLRQGREEVVRSLLIKTEMPDDTIADLTGVPTEFVREIRQKLAGQ